MCKTTDNIGVNREHKDRLFRILFSDRKNALQLYNALTGSQYTDENELEIKTLEDVIWMKMKNDVAFLVDDVLALYEHQSTVNPNLPIRGFLYFADMYRGILGKKHIYGKKLIKLPSPSYVVFYNGDKRMKEEQWLNLSDAFIHGNGETKLELRARVININHGHNLKLMDGCPILDQYAILIAKIKAYLKTMKIEAAVKLAVDDCIAEDVLKDFLMARRAEVMNSILTEYDEEQVLADIGQERYEDGITDGIAKGKAEAKAEDVLDLLEECGTIPTNLKDMIVEQKELKILKKWLKLAAKTDSIEDFMKQM